MLFILDNKSTSWFVPTCAILRPKVSQHVSKSKTGVSLETLFDSNTRQITPRQKTTHIETKKCSQHATTPRRTATGKKHNLPLRSYENKANSNQRHSQKKLKETISTSVTFEEGIHRIVVCCSKASKRLLDSAIILTHREKKGRLIYRAKSSTYHEWLQKKSTS